MISHHNVLLELGFSSFTIADHQNFNLHFNSSFILWHLLFKKSSVFFYVNYISTWNHRFEKKRSFIHVGLTFQDDLRTKTFFLCLFGCQRISFSFPNTKKLLIHLWLHSIYFLIFAWARTLLHIWRKAFLQNWTISTLFRKKSCGSSTIQIHLPNYRPWSTGVQLNTFVFSIDICMDCHQKKLLSLFHHS